MRTYDTNEWIQPNFSSKPVAHTQNQSTPYAPPPSLPAMEIWKIKIKWDDKIPEEIDRVWKLYLNELKELEDIKIPRHLYPNNPISITLHGFSDAYIAYEL